jgi:hypothetical protein
MQKRAHQKSTQPPHITKKAQPILDFETSRDEMWRGLKIGFTAFFVGARVVKDQSKYAILGNKK